MDDMQSSLKLRRCKREDVNDLHRMIIESTAGKTRITAASLGDDLFNLNRNYNPEVQSDDKCVKLDLKLLHSNKPLVEALLAEDGGELIGYLMYQYYWSPWSGHYASVVDLFVTESHRRKGIARRLLDVLLDESKADNLVGIVINTGHIDQKLIDAAERHGFVWYRYKETDWSVLRIDFKRDT